MVITTWHLQGMSSHIIILVITMSCLQSTPGAGRLISPEQQRCTCKRYSLDVHTSSTDAYFEELHDTFALRIQVHQDKLQCSQYQEIKLAAEMSSLPNNALVLQQRPTQVSHTTLYSLSYLGSENMHLAVGATFGQSLKEAGHCGPAGLGDSMCNMLGKLHYVKIPELLALCTLQDLHSFQMQPVMLV